jgi:rhodanese-related sulfurtransferase
MKRLIPVILLSLASALPVQVKAEEDVIAARSLFNTLGCASCHGENGTEPVSRYVPVLKGKSEDYLYDTATKIFSGDTGSVQSTFMHTQFCIGQKPIEGCYTPPTDDQLRVITSWLSEKELPKKKQTPQQLYVTASQAYEKLKSMGDDALLIDVRTRAEVAFLGMPTIADANIPYMKFGSPGEWDEKRKTIKMVPNVNFISSVNQLIALYEKDRDVQIFLICRSGSRSAKAAKLLNLAGYANVYNITDGFEGDMAKEGINKGRRVINGWKNSNLPWSYKLEKSKLHWESLLADKTETHPDLVLNDTLAQKQQ